MSKQAANFEGGKKNRVYHFIQELIREGKYAWFVNREGRFRINWKGAVELYIQYRAKKDPGFDSSIDRKKASNSFREALLRRYCDDGAKEYEECQKLGEKKKVVEREFQMPSKVFHSLFGSREELPGDQSESSGISVGDPELTQEDKFLQLLGDLDYEVDMEPNESRLEGGRPFRVLFHPCLDANVTSVHAVFVKSEDILGNVELFISPSCLFGHSIPGAPSSGWAIVIFKDQNDTHLGSTEIFYFPDGVEAVAMIQTPDQFKNFCEEMSFHTASSFDGSDGDPQRYGAFGNAQQVQFLCLLIHTAAREGAQQFIEMIFSTSSGRLVFDAYKDIQPLPEVVARDHGYEKTACYLEDVTKRFSVRISASNEYPKKINWSELAQAAEEAQRCNAENESCHLMSDLLKDAGYLGDLETSSSEPHSSGSEDEIAIASKKVMQDVCPSFGPSKKSKEHVDCDKISPQTIKLTTPAKSEDEEDFRGMPSHVDGTSSGYFLDADTSSCGSFEVDCEPSDSEDCDKISPQTIKLTTPESRLADADTFSCASFEVDSERSDSGGSFTKDIKPTEKESSSLNHPVEPSSEETTQFDRAEYEEKTSFGSSRFHMFNPLSRRVGGPGSNDTHHCVLSWGTFLMCAVILPRLLAGFIVKGFLFFIGVVMGLLKKSRLVCAHFCLAVGGTLIYSTNSLRSFIFGFQSYIVCKRYRMVAINCCLVVILVSIIITEGSILSGFQSCPLIKEFSLVRAFIYIAFGGIQLVCVVRSILSVFLDHQRLLRKIWIRNPIKGGFQSCIECKRYRMVHNGLFLALFLACSLMMSVGFILFGFQLFTDVKVHPKFDMNRALEVGVMLTLCIVRLFCIPGEDLPVVVAEAELKKKTENKTKEDSLICLLNYIPPQGNAPKKRKENRVFYSPESYTSFQKCSASIY